MEAAARHGQPTALLLIDVDRFKAYNDAYGHLEGDEFLKLISDCLQLTFDRPCDMVARFGGEEFVVLLPETDETKAGALAEAFLNILRAKAMPHKTSDFGIVTASVGVGCSRGGNAAALVLEADRGLYQAKRTGRNQVASRVPDADAMQGR